MVDDELFVIVVDTMTNELLAERDSGWVSGAFTVRDYSCYSGETLSVGDEPSVWLLKQEAEKYMKKAERNFAGVTFKVETFVKR